MAGSLAWQGQDTIVCIWPKEVMQMVTAGLSNNTVHHGIGHQPSDR